MSPHNSTGCRILAQRPPVAFAHRGCALDWPENTELAFRSCQSNSEVVIETDVRVTADGQLVLFHDARLDRTTNGHGALAGRSLQQLRHLDAGYWFTRDGIEFPHRGRGLRIVTLDELVEMTPNANYNVELKPGAAGVAERFWRWLQRRGLHERFLVASSGHPTLSAFRDLSAARVATSASRREVLWFLAATMAGRPARPPVVYQALQLPTRLGSRLLIEQRLLDAARAMGVAVHVWTVNGEAELRRMLELGVDGVMTDRSDFLARILRNESGFASGRTDP